MLPDRKPLQNLPRDRPPRCRTVRPERTRRQSRSAATDGAAFEACVFPRRCNPQPDAPSPASPDPSGGRIAPLGAVLSGRPQKNRSAQSADRDPANFFRYHMVKDIGVIQSILPIKRQKISPSYSRLSSSPSTASWTTIFQSAYSKVRRSVLLD